MNEQQQSAPYNREWGLRIAYEIYKDTHINALKLLEAAELFQSLFADGNNRHLSDTLMFAAADATKKEPEDKPGDPTEVQARARRFLHYIKTGDPKPPVEGQ